MNKLAEFDINALSLIRNNVESFMLYVAENFATKGGLLLDIAPQDHRGAAPFFKNVQIETLDIDPQSGATYIVDLCQCTETIGSNKFDYVVCTEVLEHTLQPFGAVKGIYQVLKPGGYAFVSTPFNFRIHGPLPDCWRFTEHGLRTLFNHFEIIKLAELETRNRWLMPLQYTLIAKKPC